jgi:hypothetical protein
VPSTEQGETSNQGLSSLTSAIFDEEQQRLDAASEEAVTLPDDLLPGVGGEGMRKLGAVGPMRGCQCDGLPRQAPHQVRLVANTP